MVCATITRDPEEINAELTVKIRDDLHKAIVEVFKVKAEDVELRIREVGWLDVNSGPLSIDIDSGPGKGSWRVNECEDLVLQITRLLITRNTVPQKFWDKGQSNVWIRIYAKGASMPIGRSDLRH